MKQNGRGFHSYFVFILLLLMVVAVLSTLRSSEQDYSRAEFIADIESGKVTEVEVNPNSETPTGYLRVVLNDGTLKRLYVTDIMETEQLVREYGFDPLVKDVPRESWV
ncbi:MAG: ATP-dependent metallopeptidase FtsH/Yme1/Tma family protein, partial [Acetatifactor sp.]|nr:ATP-dependent metallopeptidase FtsH/Yme1/Tma family protein [Acetatifactor sp.]